MGESPESFWKIRDYILNDAPRGSIISERELARKFNLSRYVTKTVLSTLEGEGLLKCLPQRGYQVIDYSETDDATILKVRCVLEGDAVRLAAERASEEDVRRLTLIMDDMNDAVARNDIDTYTSLDYEFHRGLVATSGDQMFLKIFDVMLGIHYRRGNDIPGLLALTHTDHHEILGAVKAHDKDQAELVIYRHLGLSLRNGVGLLHNLDGELNERMDQINRLIMQHEKTTAEQRRLGARALKRSLARLPSGRGDVEP